MKITIKRNEPPRRAVAKVSKDGGSLYMQGGHGIPDGKHVCLGGMYGNKASVNGTMDVTEPTPQSAYYTDVYEGDEVIIKF